MGMVNVLWLSRHAPTTEQTKYFEESFPSLEVELIHINCTFPNFSVQAVEIIHGLAEEHNCRDISGVFPAHIAARLALQYGSNIEKSYNYYFPVSVPTPAKEGEVRGSGFVHSHFEMF